MQRLVVDSFFLLVIAIATVSALDDYDDELSKRALALANFGARGFGKRVPNMAEFGARGFGKRSVSMADEDEFGREAFYGKRAPNLAEFGARGFGRK
uniref:Uncharacterized protein n=1 Tax=Plectus sambesii TaxID=2011161 RepID=A0A914UWQ4_9BILA